MVVFVLVLLVWIPASLAIGLLLGAVVHLRDGVRPVEPFTPDPARMPATPTGSPGRRGVLTRT